MSRNGSGVYTPPGASFPAVAATLIESAKYNAVVNDIATAVTESIARDGQTVITANIPMSNFKLTGLADGSSVTDSANIRQASQSSVLHWCGTSGGSANAITLTPAVAITAYVTGQTFRFIAGTTNTAAATFNISSVGAIAIQQNGAALIGGEIVSGQVYEIKLDSATTGQVKHAGRTTESGRLYPIGAAASANAMTLTLNPCILDFRSATLGSGTVNTRYFSSPLTLTITSGATLGTANAVKSRVIVVAIDNAGTVELACVNVIGGVDLTETGTINTTAMSAVSDSANVFYSTTARTGVAYRVLGYVESTQATAGTWATQPSLIQGAGGNSCTYMNAYGGSQTWQDVTGSRAKSTNYVNDTGRTITVYTRFTIASGNNNTSITVDGLQFFGTNSGASTAANSWQVQVPPGSTYSSDNIGTGASLTVWYELR